ncbi:Cytosolic Fe-S cluster assembly factor nar1 [Tilletia horrida]|uniref:Cytosolic Fe-S cluster assembly factor NAR1 n=1 Tax=Tilletia horrida TaxID=155126 RepID=A0AAN6GGU9_9BASI|nr:Cytosolic Fe-S cluster assembly factor nar1 [Tilletia horrida]
MAFSGALTLTDLNDFLGPSQACIKPVETLPEQDQQQQPQPEAGAATTQISIDADGAYYEGGQSSSGGPAQGSSEPRARTKLETAQISLNDCLACSGCVTSAETVLITMQSHEEMKRAVKEIHDGDAQGESRKLLIASISPQSLASLSARYSGGLQQDAAAATYLPLDTLLARIAHFLRSTFGFDHVVDTTFARHLALREHAAEFFQRRNEQAAALVTPQDGNALHLPMLASACPGWVCYAEKTHSELLPLISRTKSPQQIAGVLAKQYLSLSTPSSSSSSDLDVTPTRRGVYHVTIMPCYDKKLEASRSDFFDDITNTRDVDCVLTTGELDLLMQEQGFDITKPLPSEADSRAFSPDALAIDPALRISDALPTPPDSKEASESGELVQGSDRLLPNLLSHPGSSSGSYLFHLMQAVWNEWLSTQPSSSANPAPSVEVKIIRSSDFTEYVLRVTSIEASAGHTTGEGQIIFKAAQCYGFRNLQNLVRKVHKQVGITGRKSGARTGPASAASAGLDDAPHASGRARPSARGRGMVKAGAGMRRAARGGGTNEAEDGAEGNGDAAGLQLRARVESSLERGYDYIEVMACPGGCTNGGGQLRPPAELPAGTTGTAAISNLDPEGFSNGWVADAQQSVPNPIIGGGTAEVDIGLGAGSGPDMQKGWQGTSKEWVRRVEAAYWAPTSHGRGKGDVLSNGGPGPEAPRAEDSLNARVSGGGVPVRDVQRRSEALLAQLSSTRGSEAGADLDAQHSSQWQAADRLAESIMSTLCRPSSEAVKGANVLSADEIRAKLLRTHYHAVQDNEVSGLAVQW